MAVAFFLEKRILNLILGPEEFSSDSSQQEGIDQLVENSAGISLRLDYEQGLIDALAI